MNVAADIGQPRHGQGRTPLGAMSLYQVWLNSGLAELMEVVPVSRQAYPTESAP